ncbi:MAG TPA: SLBB domain-containing protein [Allosphingosinicella sp.]|nr:SLBB domain-containing protein [Allosphingosinicella sp.]
MPLKHLVAAIALTLTLSGCLASTNYAPGEIALTPSSRTAAQQANARIEAALGAGGDFRPGDLVRISFPYLPALDADQRVQPSGFITPPLLDPIQTRGMTAAQLQQRLERLYQPKLERPVVAVAMVEYNRKPEPPEYFVLGEVIRPGAVEYREGTTLLEAIARAGGANRQAKLSTVVLVEPRGEQMVARLIDVDAMLGGRGDGLPRRMDYVGPNTVIIVPPTNLLLSAERSETIRRIIGFTGFGTGFRIGLGNENN